MRREGRELADRSRTERGAGRGRKSRAARRDPDGPKVGHAHVRQAAAADPLGHGQQSQLARLGVRPALQRGRGRAQHADRFGSGCAHQSHVAGLIAGRLGLLVAAVVLFVHHDRPQPGHGRKNRRTRPDRDSLLARPQQPPSVVALRRREPRMQHRHQIAEGFAKTTHRLGRQGDFGHQHDGSLAARQDVLEQLDVDQRLSRSGDAMEQKGAALAQRGLHGLQRFLLRRRRRRQRGRPARFGVRPSSGDAFLERIAGDGLVRRLRDAPGHQSGDDAPAEAAVQEGRKGHAPARLPEPLVRLALPRGLSKDAVHLVERSDLARDPDKSARARRLQPRKRRCMSHESLGRKLAHGGPEARRARSAADRGHGLSVGRTA